MASRSKWYLDHRLWVEAFVLVKRAPAEAFQSFELFSAEAGALRAMQRISRKAAGGSVALDLFDEADLRLESGNQGRTWFVREVRLIERPVGIGMAYGSGHDRASPTSLRMRHEARLCGMPLILRTPES